MVRRIDWVSTIGHLDEFFGVLVEDKTVVVRLSGISFEEFLDGLEGAVGPPMGHKHAAERARGVVRIATDGSYDDNVRRPQSCAEVQRPHVDGCFLDKPPAVVALYCEQSAEVGGESTLVYSSSVVDYLINRYSLSELAPLFDDDSYRIRRGSTVISRPVLQRMGPPEDHRLAMYFSWHEFNDVEPSPRCVRTMEAIREYVGDPAYQTAVKLEPGLCLLLVNASAMHGRREWRDSPARRRAMLRVWFAHLPIGYTDGFSHDLARRCE